jgi:cysteine desulfurase/selenocysteine lyase
MKTSPITEQEILGFRSETKGTAGRIHFNNAGASMPPAVVVDTICSYLNEEAVIGGYETEFKYKAQLENTYASIAKLINAEKEEIAIVENASTAWILAFYGVSFEPGDEIITCEMEYVTNLIGLLHAEKTQGISIRVIPNDEDGNFSMEAFRNAISSKTKLIAMTQIPSTAGGMIPVVEIGTVAREKNILYLVDACQSAGQVPIDVKEMNCDMLSVTGRKYLRAPRGTGFLYVRKEVQDKLRMLFMDGFSVQQVSEHDFKPRDDARRFELYEKNRALVLGLGKAVDYALDIGVDRIWERIKHLSSMMRNLLENIDGVTVHDKGTHQCGIITFSINGMETAIVKSALAEKNINVSVGLAKSTLYYMNRNHLMAVVRASVHYYNTEDEIIKCCEEITKLCAEK